MTVVILTAVPPGLRGHLTRWLLELSPGVFVGYVSARVRALMWQRIVEYVQDGRALMVHAVRGEQRLAFHVHGHDWTPVDYDGITLMRRKTVPDYTPTESKPSSGGASAAKVGGFQSETVWKRRESRKKFRKRKTEE
ncbi:type I-E CRISPR-associated endoribonuclease Cas2e [Haloechinothrix sp. LS1_15]|uniref:type I-E CRISPR-associated endoribonuclease Cas2e n=1 Tax=Haloechinothrix sp. LS1_15 TaxID=2652248 RepID=UPI002947F382|nr:type I-E CRISPR-associated endoribonuclease Cas2e [Haloechinothrix sp. LS1_15]MDV6013049.1 type I-E CRISPR-associated endoribonuclease Cas2 [Haloechinothrix sp. LS1_15]